MNMNEFYLNLINLINIHVLGKKTDTYDVLTFANIVASYEAATHYNLYMTKAENFENDLALLTHAMDIRKIEGSIVEFGVASGRTINHISNLTKQTVYGFDVFSGLPETWRTGFPQGTFRRSAPPEVNHNVELIEELFEDTIDIFAEKSKNPIALLHIDCDLYSSTKVIFDCLDHLIVPGTIIVFDEYFNYPGWMHHEHKAFQEFIARKNLSYLYDSFVSKHQQVCVIIK